MITSTGLNHPEMQTLQFLFSDYYKYYTGEIMNNFASYWPPLGKLQTIKKYHNDNPFTLNEHKNYLNILCMQNNQSFDSQLSLWEAWVYC